ncbi:MAG: methionine--tRNA ligase [Alphaproteobacteria bacterium]
MVDNASFYVTTPIYYVNDRPHIGHAYTSLACDIIARFKRLDGHDVFFLTGTDEHGQKIAQSAAQNGVDPQTFTDHVSKTFRDLASALDFSHDDFIRTTEQRHKSVCQLLWTELEARGHIYLDTYSGWYCVSDEAYYDENELIKQPDGSFQTALGKSVEWLEEENYFFRLSAFETKLLDLYERQPDFVMPKSRLNEVRSFVSSGLKDIAISRTTFDWGVPVPGNERHVMYVWLDALTNYVSALGVPNSENPHYAKFWPASLHVVGKDILRFHAVYWPAFLLGADWPLPERVFAHGWWTNEGQKISKSLGNAIDPLELVQTYGLDQTRYFMMREVPFGNDGDFSRSAMETRMNSDLANAYGNLAQRVLSMIFKNCNGLLPDMSPLNETDTALLSQINNLLPSVRVQINNQEFHKSLEEIWRGISAANSYVDDQAPWALKKNDPDRMAVVLAVLHEVVRKITLLLQPFMPSTTGKLLDSLSVDQAHRDFSYWEHKVLSGTAIEKPQGLFPRYEAR